jgi:DNA-binding response OmpR family regulator
MAAVLIVDDDVVIRDVLYELFSEEHLCHTAETAERGLELLQSLHYDIAIIDISLPGMSGLELLGHIHERWPDIPVIIVTGIDYHKYAANLIKMGAFDYIEKPFQLKSAEGKLAKAILYRERWLDGVKDSADRALKHGKRLMEERRVSVRHRSQRTLRLQFSIARSDVRLRAEAPPPLPPVVGYTTDVSEGGLALVIPCVEITDCNFFGAEGPLQVTLSLPTGIVELQATPVRYEWLDKEQPSKGFLIGTRITGMNEESTARLKGFLEAFPPPL